MPQDQLRNAIDVLRARLQQELEAQLVSLTEQQEEAIQTARRAAEADAEQRWTAQLESVRGEWVARLDSEVSAARAETERRFADQLARVRAEGEQAAARLRAEAEQTAARFRAEAEHAAAQVASRIRAEAEQAATQAAMRVREEAEQEIDSERKKAFVMLDEERARAAADLDAERERAAAALDAERKRVETERQAERQRAEADRQAERQRFEAERQQFRSERQRFEGERQHFAIERDRFEAQAKEHEVVLRRLECEVQEFQSGRQRTEQLDADLRRLESELAGERRQLKQVTDALRVANESLRRVEDALEQERLARAQDETARQQTVAPVPASPDISEITDARAAERDSQLAIIERLLDAMRSMSAAGSLTETLGALVEAAGAEAPRAALFIASGDHLQGLKAVGFPGDIRAERMPIAETGLLGQVMQRGEAVSSSDEPEAEMPSFAALPADRAAIAVPITVGGEVVAVLYADDGGVREQSAPASWPEAVQILGSHASSCLAHVTAVRTAQAMRLASGTPPPDDESSAKRYARLLVSEIKLYNEAAVRVGRENRDLLYRLRPEIERARKLYEERVPAGAGVHHTFFHQELVQTLADGDPALLGNPA